jgi:hypothetical protein
MQNASVYSFPDRLLVAPNCPTPMGVLLSSEPHTVLSLAAPDHELGIAIEAALFAPTRTVPHPADWKAASAPRLAAAGVKSERAFQLKSALVQVSKTPESVRVSPSHNGGATGDDRGFHPILGAEMNMSGMVGATELAAQVRKALMACTR